MTGSDERVEPLRDEPVHAEVVASDRDLGWLLMADAGRSLHELPSAEGIGHWERALPAYARLQQDVTPDADELADAVAFDRGTHRLPEAFEQALADRELLLVASRTD